VEGATHTPTMFTIFIITGILLLLTTYLLLKRKSNFPPGQDTFLSLISTIPNRAWAYFTNSASLFTHVQVLLHYQSSARFTSQRTPHIWREYNWQRSMGQWLGSNLGLNGLLDKLKLFLSPAVLNCNWGSDGGTFRAVMLHGGKLIKEAFNEPLLSGRCPTEATSFIVGDEYGILQATGEVWTEQRRFAIKTLRDFGFGRASMEDMILEEAKELCDWLKKQKGEPVELNRRFSLAVVNSLWRILTGERHEHDDKALLEILDNLER